MLSARNASHGNTCTRRPVTNVSKRVNTMTRFFINKSIQFQATEIEDGRTDILLHNDVSFPDEEVVVTGAQLVVFAMVEKGVGNDGALIHGTEHVKTTIGNNHGDWFLIETGEFKS